MIRWIRRVFCFHRFKEIREEYPLFYNVWILELLQCEKCGKEKPKEIPLTKVKPQ